MYLLNDNGVPFASLSLAPEEADGRTIVVVVVDVVLLVVVAVAMMSSRGRAGERSLHRTIIETNFSP